MGQRWGAAGPPDEAYSRVSDPHRYDALPGLARDLIGRLEREYDVTHHRGSELQAWSGVEVETITLTPSAPTASPLTVVFGDPFGLRLRFGVGHVEPIPDCGCDACDEDLEDCGRMLAENVATVIAGTFGERLDGRWHVRWSRGDDRERSGRTLLTRHERARLLRRMPAGESTWGPWPPRG